MKIDKSLVKKYLNYKAVDCEFDSLIDDVFSELLIFCTPKKMCVVSDCQKKDGFYYLNDLGISLISNDINNLFCECEQIAAMAVTLGISVDRKIDFYSKVDMKRSVVMDAVASVYVESVMDSLEEELRLQFSDKYATMRFSAGYGDLDIKLQKHLITSLGADKFLGISVNDNYLMSPLKSITAFIGFSNKPQLFSNICLSCPLKGKCKVKCSKAKSF